MKGYKNMNSLRNRLAKRRTSRPNRSYRLCLEPLEARQLLSAPPNDLHDALVKPIADAEFIRDNGQLSRSDVIHLLDVVDGTEKAVFTNGGLTFKNIKPNPLATLTASQLTDLQTLDADACSWGMSPDVANLLGKTVNQNPANEHFQGASLLASGQLSAGTLDWVLQDLVGKWFYGTDLPNATTAAANAGIPDTVVYRKAQGVLFGANGPSPNDIAQGWLGDCYFMSSMGEIALQSPQTIQNMILDNGDGTDTVRFFEYNATNNTWQPDYVTVNLQLPVLQHNGQYAFAGWYQGGTKTTYRDTDAVLWPALVEKAYAQLAEEGWSRSTAPGGSGINGTPSDWDTNSYDALNEGDGVALQQLGGSNITYDVGLASATAKDEAALVKAFNHGSLVIVGSLSQEPANTPTNAAGAPLIIATHVYMLKDADLATDRFTLINPLDDSSKYPSDGQRTVTLTWAQLKRYLNDYFVVNPPPICPAHAVIQNGVNTGINGFAPITHVVWYDNGRQVSGPDQVHEGDTVTVTFDTLPGAKDTEFSLVAYAAPNGTFNSWNIDHQQEWADTTGTYKGAGHHSLTVTLPKGYFQLDFVYGAAIADFATGDRYHSDGRFIAGATGGDQLVNCGC
jgi:hypothetical protein